ncbi:MAG: hypothetical protein C5B49_02860 [Bdellovibrio sp.]|nr:MAG: hypothetical protein C5B49_02860 [Bdellovibrio sp.]
MERVVFLRWFRILALATGYFLSARILFLLPNEVGSSVWPPTGLSLATVLLFGEELWPGVLLGAWLVAMSSGLGPLASLIISLGSTLGNRVAVLTVGRYLKLNCALCRFGDVAALIVGGAFVSTLIPATVGEICILITGHGSLITELPFNAHRMPLDWFLWWLRDMMSVLVFTPVILVWSVPPRRRLQIRTMHSAALILLGIFSVLLVFDHLPGLSFLGPMRAYLLFPLFSLIAFRFGPRGTASLAFFVTIVGVLSTIYQRGPFLGHGLLESLMNLQVFIGILTITGLLMTAVISERRELEEKVSFLAEASRVLSLPGELSERFQTLMELCVPLLADWCWIDLVNEGHHVERIALSHSDRRMAELACRIRSGLPLQLDTPGGVHEVIRTGKSVLLNEVKEQDIVQIARELQVGDEAWQVGVRSVMITPISVRDKCLGALTFLSAQSGRKYSGDDLNFANELAGRVSGILKQAQLLREARVANRAKDDFLAALSHELRTPLNVILGWVQILRQEKLSEAETKSALDTLERNAAIQVNLINDLLDVSRIVAGKFRLDRKPLELSTVVRNAVDSHQMLAAQKRIELQLLSNVSGHVLADEYRLQQLMGNLITNAIKFTPEGGRVSVWVESERCRHRILVQDTGQGIEEQFLPIVFEAFRQEGGGASRSHGGLGLGLSIVRHIARLHGGEVTAQSEGKNRGSTFTLNLPGLMVRGMGTDHEGSLHHMIESDKAPESIHPGTLDGTRILLVDDSPDILFLVNHWLTLGGGKVSQARSADEALQLLKMRVFDVLLSDIGMPGVDGYQLIRKIRALPPSQGGNIPAAAITAYAREEEEKKALEAGFQLHIPKPIGGIALIQSVLKLRNLAGTAGDHPPKWFSDRQLSSL